MEAHISFTRSERAARPRGPRASAALATALALGAVACRTAVPEAPPPASPPGAAAREEPRAPEPGRSAAAPLPPGSDVDLSAVRVEVALFERGDAALRRLRAAGMPASLPRVGSELALVELRVRGVADESWVGCRDFRVAGSSRVVYFHAPRAFVTPELETGVLRAGDTRTGWCAYAIPTTERDLFLLLSEPGSRDPAGLRYLALEPGASIALAPAAASTPMGVTAADPAPLGSEVITGDWSVKALEVLRGEAASRLVLDADEQNEPPQEGLEFVAVKLRARYFGRSGQPGLVSPAEFRAVSASGEVYPRAIVIDVRPRLSSTLLPGGEHTGWGVFQVARGDASPLLRFQPFYPDEGRRFLALTPEPR
ncbi:MAG TPA: hypothetical protein VMW19_13460 [Myxococcota bacterium]|nr:hypothetical protein [Myxococcota bacterium]